MIYFYSILSYILYSFLVASLFVTSLISSFATGHYIISGFKVIVIIFLVYEIYVEWRQYLYKKKSDLMNRQFTSEHVYIFLSVFLGALFSYLLNHNFELGAVVASSLIGLIGGLLLPKMAVAIYCGSFAGMVSSLLISDLSAVILVGIFAGILFVAGAETFKGFGGKLGATAYFATLVASFFFNTFSETMTGASVSLEYDVFIVFIIGSLSAYFINTHYKIGAVVASSLLGLTFALILPNVFPNGNALAVALFCGTFIGMSTTSKLSTWISVILASAIGTVIFLYTAPYFAGLGGKLGLIAFGSTIATAGIYNTKNYIVRRWFYSSFDD